MMAEKAYSPANDTLMPLMQKKYNKTSSSINRSQMTTDSKLSSKILGAMKGGGATPFALRNNNTYQFRGKSLANKHP